MLSLKTSLLGSLNAALALLLIVVLVLWLKPPALLRVAANYSAKIVCSNVFVAGRDAQDVLLTDVQAPGALLLRLMRVSVDRERGVVRAGLLGFIGDGLAIARPGVGCAVVPPTSLLASTVTALPLIPAAPTAPGPEDLAWPEGEALRSEVRLQRTLQNDMLAGPGARAIVIVHQGRIAAERYAAGFSAYTPLLGWSMTKSVTAGLIGILIKDGRLSLDQSGFWSTAIGDQRGRIRITDLLAMSSGLHFDESYGAVVDVTRMLYLEPDMAAFARAQPLDHPVGKVWSYSSGTAVILSRIFQDTVGPDALNFAHRRLFDAIGMRSTIVETDARGTLVGSSYMYANAHDWARYGQLLLQDGVWEGHAVLPAGYVAMMRTPVAASHDQYAHGMVWRWGSDALTPGVNPDTAFGLPADTFWMEGHDGQFIAMVPSESLVIVRLGLTPSRDHYQPQALVRAILDAVNGA